MKYFIKTPACCVFLLCFALGGINQVYGQAAGMSDVEVTIETETEAGVTTFTPGEEARFIPTAPGPVRASDSIMLQISDFPMQRAAQRPPTGRSNEKPKTKDDDSILTFNFLYYIIQKYKLQDIID